MKMKKSFLSPLIAVFAVFCGCVSQQQQGDPRIVLDPYMQSAINVVHVDYGETKMGVKTVDVTIENKKSKARSFKLSAQWYSNGQAFNSRLAEPRHLSLLPNEVMTIHEVAPNAKQDSFRIFISKE